MATLKLPPQPRSAGRENEAEWLEVTPGERFTIRTSCKATNDAYVVLEFVAEPGNGVPMHIHDNEEEHFIIVEGTAHMANGDTMVDLTAGSAITVDKGVPHAWCNRTEAPLRMLVIFTPGHIEGLFRAVAEANGGGDMLTIANAYHTRIVGPPLLEGMYTTFSPRSQEI
jgi:mannose-6-phosphate isomerase-like protein (cupin superfamily)